jgi:hypothetical protein
MIYVTCMQQLQSAAGLSPRRYLRENGIIQKSHSSLNQRDPEHDPSRVEEIANSLLKTLYAPVPV